MDQRIKELLNYIQGSKDILEGKCAGACVTNALLNLDAMETLVKELRDSPREQPDDSYSGDLEYHVDTMNDGVSIFENFDDAAVAAMTIAATRGESQIDVVVWSEDGARKFGGDDAVEQYHEDPEASVFERLQVRVNNQGRVP